MSVDTAERYISVSTLPAKIRSVRNLDLSVLYHLAKPGTPREVIDDVVRRVRAGEAVTTRTVSITTTERPTTTVVIPRVVNPEPRRTTPERYADLLSRSDDPARLPAPERAEPEVPREAAAFLDALAASLPLPDARLLAAAYRAQARLSVANICEIADALRELVQLLLDDESWQHWE
ncbi:MAG TPA: hypothetical protein VKE42_00825, partial [Candidatus Cybelea sp.]|nr:hypothetical protein [Candidatus Cybelea sp.]